MQIPWFFGLTSTAAGGWVAKMSPLPPWMTRSKSEVAQFASLDGHAALKGNC